MDKSLNEKIEDRLLTWFKNTSPYVQIMEVSKLAVEISEIIERHGIREPVEGGK